MNYVLIMITMLIATAGSAYTADNKVITCFSDGALVEVEATANKGIAEIALLSGMVDNSLRIKPLGNAAIQRVDILTSAPEHRRAKELDTLYEQKSRLEDRLLALNKREEIFKSAAKSQSGKAPRKTKTNLDPMQSIRQGTDFAIAQLESVYTARRKTEAEIRRLDASIALSKKGGQGGGQVARVSVTPKNGRIKVRYGLERLAWTPRYDLRLNGDGNAIITLMGQLPTAIEGYLFKASPGNLAANYDNQVRSVADGAVGRLAEYRLPTLEEQFGSGLRSAFSFVITNSGGYNLPSGEATLYRKGEYWGKFRFEGLSSSSSRRFVSGG